MDSCNFNSYKAMLKLPLSLWGKINIIEMTLRLRLMYVLSGIPVLIPISCFTEMNKLMRKFLL